MWVSSSFGKWGLRSGCGAPGPHCGGSLVAEQGSRVHRLLLLGTRDLPGPGIESAGPHCGGSLAAEQGSQVHRPQ